MALFKPEFGLVFWMFVSFVLLLFVLGKYAWPVIIKALDDREIFINNGVEFTKNAIKEMDLAKAEAQTIVSDARKQQMEILKETDRLKKQMIEDAKTSAAAEVRKMLDDASLSIEQARRENELQFRKQVGVLSLQVAEKLLRRELSGDESQMELIDKYIDELEKK